MQVRINGIELVMDYGGLSGLSAVSGCSAAYNIRGVSHPRLNGITLPSPRVLKRLAREYLDSSIHEFWRTPHLGIGIKGGLSEERRAAFLATVTAHCTVLQ